MTVPPKHFHADGGVNPICEQLVQDFQGGFDMVGVVVFFAQIDNLCLLQSLDPFRKGDDVACSGIDDMPGLPCHGWFDCR